MNDDTPAAAHPRRTSFNLFTAFLLLATLTLSILVLLLMRQNRNLRSETTALRQLTGEAALPTGEMLASLETFAPPPTHSPGVIAPATDTPTPDAMTFIDGRLGTFLYLFSSSCGSCETIMPRVAALSARHTPSGVECFAIQIDANAPADLAHTDLGLPVRGVHEAPRTWLRRVPLVPAMVLINHDGVLVRAWYGAPDELQWAQIESELAAISGAAASIAPPK
ncbi:MAG: hypothetical protein KIT19_04405 [Phycisphaeraceae bacterium]|nr:hypothetical protein [Phycisphaeraceae bacterium]